MKLKKVRIVVETTDKTSRRWTAALKGKARGHGGPEVISVPSFDVLGRVLSPPRLEILSRVSTIRPTSIANLAKVLERDFKNVHADVTFLASLGLLDLKEEGPRGTLVPTARYSEIDLPLAA